MERRHEQKLYIKKIKMFDVCQNKHVLTESLCDALCVTRSEQEQQYAYAKSGISDMSRVVILQKFYENVERTGGEDEKGGDH